LATLTLLDVAGIQSFVFGSNRLQQNIGGSYLVKESLGGWLRQIRGTEELVFSGGGKALVKSLDKSAAKALVGKLSLLLLEKAPGLTPFCAHCDWDDTDGSFCEKYEQLHEALRENKSRHWPEPEFDGFGVVATAAPNDSLAVEYDDKKSEWKSATGVARAQAAKFATERLQESLNIDLPHGYEWTVEMDQLGRSRGERSLLGVIHFDGNSMGKRFEAASKDGLQALAMLSAKIEEAGSATLKHGMNWVIEHLPDFEKQLDLKRTFPVRPILYGGDDITLVCDGRIALDLAAELLEAWRRQDVGFPLSACAGVALVPVRFPFFRAYQISENCCKEAKTWLRESKIQTDTSALSWRIQAGGAIEGAKEHNQRLTAKPYLLPLNEGPAVRDWNWFRSLVEEWAQLKERDDDEGKRLRSQLKAFGEALRTGRGEHFLNRAKSAHPGKWGNFPEPPGKSTSNGFFDGVTPYLDALELMDRVVPNVYKRERVLA
jgi:hypothetical protein